MSVDSWYKQALFLVQTPFQCMCMIEAISHYKIEQYDVLVPKAGGSANEEMVARLLIGQKIPYEPISADSWQQNVYQWLYKRHNKYKYVFIGYYYSNIERAMAAVMSCFRGQRIFLDDGTQALEIFSNHSRSLYSNWKIALRSIPFVLLGQLKLLKKPIFYTIYDVESKRIHIEKNSFSSFRNKDAQTPNGVFIIGANSSALDFSSYSYMQLLELLIYKISHEFKETPVFYCPHRRDINNPIVIKALEDKNIQIFNTRISVEYDFLTQKIYPKYIIGFTSNALFTLHNLFENAHVFTVYYDLKSDSANSETLIIRNKLNEYGINNLYVY